MKLACIGLLALVLLTGCRPSSTESKTPGATGNGNTDPSQQTESEGAGVGGWMQDTWDGAVSTGGQTVQDTTEWMNKLYQSAKDQGLTTAANAKEWVASDLNSMGDWEYQILSMDPADPQAIQTQLNKLGKSRWECFHVSDRDDNWTLFLKRSKRSYLSRVPLRDLVNVLPLMGSDDGDNQ